MRIAGINSPDYHKHQLHNKRSQNLKSDKLPSAGERAGSASPSSHDAVVHRTNDSTTPHAIDPGQDLAAVPSSNTNNQFPATRTQPNGELMANNAVRGSMSKSTEQAAFVSAGGVRAQGYMSYVSTAAGQDSGSKANNNSHPIPDNTSHKARAAVSAYLYTQFIEERLRFKETVGIDEYA